MAARRKCSDNRPGLPALHLKLNWDHGPTLFRNFYYDLNSEHVFFIHVYSASGYYVSFVPWSSSLTYGLNPAVRLRRALLVFQNYNYHYVFKNLDLQGGLQLILAMGISSQRVV